MNIKLYNHAMVRDSIVRIFVQSSLILGLIAGAAVPASAQDQVQTPQVSRPAPKAQAPADNLSMPPGNEEVTILRDNFAGKYNVPTLENLSKLYWRLGAFDFEDTEAVANFMKINDCKIYTEYLNDDMEWQKIVDVMKDHLKKSSGTFPLNFQFVLELHLGRYDPVKGGFPITDKTAFIDSKRIEVDSIDNNAEICFDARGIKDYPRSVIILLPEPFTLDFVKLDEHVAQAYILRKKSEFSKLEESKRAMRYERDAYLRLRVTFSQYNGNLRADQNNVMAILYGSIDGYEIFEDSTQKRLMASVDLKALKKAEAEQPQMSVPAQTATVVTTTETVKPAAGFHHEIPAEGMVPASGMALTTP